MPDDALAAIAATSLNSYIAGSEAEELPGIADARTAIRVGSALKSHS
jgi:hypothetical protein